MVIKEENEMRWLRRWVRFVIASMIALTLCLVVIVIKVSDNESASSAPLTAHHHYATRYNELNSNSHHNHNHHHKQQHLQHHNYENQENANSYAVTYPVVISNKHSKRTFRPAFYLKRNSSSQLPVNSDLKWNENREYQSHAEQHQLLDLNNFQFIKDCSHVCELSSSNAGTSSSSLKRQSQSTFLVSLVHSSPANFKKRNIIRRTWGSVDQVNNLPIKVVFIIGLVNEQEVQQEIDEESRLFNDIVQGTFHDSYRNLTYKHMSGYKWVLNYCNNTRFIMKTDDDAFIDIFNVVQVLYSDLNVDHDHDRDIDNDKTRLDQQPRDILACSLFPDGTSVKREGKWQLSYAEYPFDSFPPYCSGVAYFLTMDVLYDLYKSAHLVHPVLTIDDVFLTGIVASTLRLNHIALNELYIYEPKKLREWLYNGLNLPSSYMIGDIGDVPDWETFMLKLWIKTLNVWKQYYVNYVN